MCQKPVSFLQCWFPFFRLRTFVTLSPRGTQPEREAKCHTHLTTSFIWEELLIVKATSKILSKLQFQRPSSFRDPSVQKYISKLITKTIPHHKERALRLVWNVQPSISAVLRNRPTTSLEIRWDGVNAHRRKKVFK